MCRMSALALLLLLAPSAHAVPITGYATGRVLDAYAYPGQGEIPYVFTLGELVTLEFAYDTDPVLYPYQPFAQMVFSTPGGFLFETGQADSNRTDSYVSVGEAGGVLGGIVRAETWWSIYAFFDGDDVIVSYGREFPRRDSPPFAGHGFYAELTRTDGPIPTPEPSTILQGLVGAAVVGAGWMRRRRAD